MLTEIQEKKIAHLFHVLDNNKNGSLQMDDFVGVSDEIIAHLGWSEADRKARVLINKASRLFIQLAIDIEHADIVDIDDADISITFDDWMKFFEKELSYKSQGGLLDHYIHRTSYHLFSLFDFNDDEYISKEEFNMMFGVYRIPLEACEKSFQMLDKNGDKMISSDELISAIEDYFESTNADAPGNWLFGDWTKTETSA
jgi:Ca2+-binding EF-hand superfamily protein